MEAALGNRNLKKSTGHKAPIIALFPAAGPKDLVSGDETGVFLHWHEGSEAYELLTLPEKLQATAYNAKTGTLAAVSATNTVYVAPFGDPGRLKTRNDLEMRITSLDVSPDGRSVLLGSADSRVYRWRFMDEELARGQEEREKTFERYVAHASVVSAVCFHPFGRIFFSGDWMGRVNVSLLFDADRFGGRYDKNIFEGRAFSEKQVVRRGGARPGTSRGGVSNLRISEDGKLLALGDEAGMVELWQIRGFKMLSSIQAHKGSVIDLDIRPDLSRVVSLARDGHLMGWTISRDELNNASLAPLFDTEIFEARAITSLASGRIAVGFADGSVKILDPGALPRPDVTPVPEAAAAGAASGSASSSDETGAE